MPEEHYKTCEHDLFRMQFLEDRFTCSYCGAIRGFRTFQEQQKQAVDNALKSQKERFVEEIEKAKKMHDMPNEGDQYMMCGLYEAIEIIKKTYE